MKSSKSVILNKGDVIKTNPQNGYWGCALVLNIERSLRVGEGRYCDDGKEVCIEIHTRRMKSGQEVIGRIDNFPFEMPKLTYEVGKGKGYPLCGPITAILGYQAVIAWRKVNEKEAFLMDVKDSRQKTEDVLRKVKI